LKRVRLWETERIYVDYEELIWRIRSLRKFGSRFRRSCINARAAGGGSAARGTPADAARVEASLKWLTRGYGMDVEEVVGDAVFQETHEA